jgi:2-phospho-L-lactate/phosphoenolpyruvate guanylyltransferase
VNIGAIVPQKPLSMAKSRLRQILPAGARASLSLALLERVFTALRAGVGIETVVVMTPDPVVAAFAAARGVRAVPDLAPSLNAALAEVFRPLSRCSRGILVISADLPLLQPADIAAIVAAADARTLVVAPSKDTVGTNALLLPPTVAFRPAFGQASLAAHRHRAEALGLRAVLLHRPGLAFDLDTPADLAALRSAQTFNSLSVPVTM